MAKLTDKQLEDFWKLADENSDGNVTIQELSRAVRKYDSSVSDAVIAGMFCAIDSDGSRTMSKKEYMKEMKDKQDRAIAMDKLFKKYDKEGKNCLRRGEVMDLIKDCFPADRTDEIIGQFLMYSDKDGNGIISYDEFRAFFG